MIAGSFSTESAWFSRALFCTESVMLILLEILGIYTIDISILGAIKLLSCLALIGEVGWYWFFVNFFCENLL